MQTDAQIKEMHRRADIMVAADLAASYAKAPICWSCEAKIAPPHKSHGHPPMCTSCRYGSIYETPVCETSSEEE